MKRNEGTLDRIIRAITGVALMTVALSLSGAWKWVLLALSVIALITALTGFCGLYKLLGISTNKDQKKEQ